MNSQLAIIVVIDVERAIRQKGLDGCAYMIDNGRFNGSTGEGGGGLVTKVVGNQIMNWLVTGIDFSGRWPNPVLYGVEGEAVKDCIIVPLLFDSPVLNGSGGLWWGATVAGPKDLIHKYILRIWINDAKRNIDLHLDLNASVHVTRPYTKPPKPGAQSSFDAAQPLWQQSTLALDPNDPAVAALRADPNSYLSLFRPKYFGPLK